MHSYAPIAIPKASFCLMFPLAAPPFLQGALKISVVVRSAVHTKIKVVRLGVHGSRQGFGFLLDWEFSVEEVCLQSVERVLCIGEEPGFETVGSSFRNCVWLDVVGQRIEQILLHWMWQWDDATKSVWSS